MSSLTGHQEDNLIKDLSLWRTTSGEIYLHEDPSQTDPSPRKSISKNVWLMRSISEKVCLHEDLSEMYIRLDPSQIRSNSKEIGLDWAVFYALANTV